MRWLGDLSPFERDSVANGIFAAFTLNIVGAFGPLLLLDALRASDQQIAMWTSLPAVASVVGFLLGAAAIARLPGQKVVTVAAFGISRFLTALIAVVPFLPVSLALRAWAVIGLWAAANVPNAFASIGWQNWVGSLVAAERRADFFAERNRLVTVAGLVVVIIAGVVLQRFSPYSAVPYAPAFFACGVFAVLELFYLARHPDRPPAPTRLAWGAFRDSLRQPRYGAYLTALGFYFLAWEMTWPLYPLWQIGRAHATAIWAALLTAAVLLAAVVSYRWWGTVSKTVGIPRALFWSTAGFALSPLLTPLSLNLVWQVVVSFLGGLFLSGFGLLIFNELLALAPDALRLPMVTFYNLVVGLVGVVAPELGILTLKVLPLGSAILALGGLRLVAAVLLGVATGVPLTPRRRRRGVAASGSTSTALR